MKALPEKTEGTDDVDDGTVDANVIDERGNAVLECDNVIEILSSESEAEEKVQFHSEEEEEQEEEEEEEEEEEKEVIYSKSRRSKKKHKKHHHHHHHHHHHEHGGTRIRKKHKKRSKEGSGPIFLWAKKEESKILKIYCEDYDPGIKLVKTNGVWSSTPRSRVLAAAQSRSSVSGHIDVREVRETPNDRDESVEQNPRPDNRITSSEPILVDLNDNSIDFVDTISSDEEDDEEQTRARIDRALEMIDQDPALMSDVKISLPTIETTSAIKLPEGTTIHQIKTENVTVCATISVTTPPPPPPPPPPALPLLSETSTMCNVGELTITTQQQNEPLNLETVSKRSALEIRLQEPPLKKKRVDKSPPAQPPLVSGHVKREWDPLSELKEVLSDPCLSVPDPLLVPRARLAALVASPATEIPKLLREPSLLPPPPPDPDLLAVSLSHLRSILQQQPGYADDRKSDGNQSSNIDQMLWLSYLSKDMTGVDADLISTMLSILLPNSTTAQQSFSYPQDKNQWNDMYYDGNIEPPYSSTPGYSKSDDCCASVSPLPPPPPLPQILPSTQQPHTLLLPPPPPSQMLPPTNAQPLKHQQSQLLPPSQPHVQQQQVPRLLPKRSLHHNMTSQVQRLPSHPQQMSPQILPSRPQQLMPPLLQPPVLHRQPKRRVCQELCCNGSPSSCYGGSCCPKPSGYNPFTPMSPNGCNPFAVSPSDCNPFTATPAANCGAGNPKNCVTYASSGAMPTCCFPSDIGCGYNGRSPSSPMPPRNPSVSPRNRAQYNYHTGPGQQQQIPMTEVGNAINGCCIGVTGCSSGVTGCNSVVTDYSNVVAGCNSGVSDSSSDINGSNSGINGSNSGVNISSGGVNNSSSGIDASTSGVTGCSSDVNGNSSGSTVSDIGVDSQCSTATNKPKTPLPATPASGDAGKPAYRPKIKVKEHLIDPNAKPRLLNIEGALHLAAGHDLFSSPLWHPLFGSQAKPYGCRWQWTTPVTTSASTSSDDTPADTKR
uniref:Uncharacterized protein n=1 Tax=Schizaphis graminum TaxID=13262 RepID=A0A2S2NBW2_SCHGA